MSDPIDPATPVTPTGPQPSAPQRRGFFNKAQLADIAAYLGTTEPIELGAALLLEQAGYERTQVQLALDLGEESGIGTGLPGEET